MIQLKSDREIEAINTAGTILARALDRVRQACEVKVRTRDLDRIAEEFILECGARPAFKGYRGFPATLCISINEEVVHGIPGPRRIRPGDIVSVDCGVIWDGYIADSAITIPVGDIADETRRLLQVTEEALFLGIEQAKAGNYVRNISAAVQQHVERAGFSVVRELVGHGVGREMHEDPQVPNYTTSKRGARLDEGLVIAIEPMVNAGDFRVTVKRDKWTIVTIDHKPSAHFEHTVAITKNGPRILTKDD
ncbi:MAG: type I methionyl aminopeptidase [Armatimonadetes bacterium]|nr:type I methionyl aminopeptidase [Armatimonadota bacterium]